MANEPPSPDRPFPDFNPPVYLSAGHTAHATEQTGIQRVTRSMARELQASGLRVEFIEWVQRRRRYVVLDDTARRKLARESGPGFESTDEMLTRVLPQAGGFLPFRRQPGGSANASSSFLSEERILSFEAIIRSIRHPMPGVPGWIDYLPVPRSLRRATRRGIRHTVNSLISWRKRSMIRRYIREIKTLRRTHNRMTRQIIRLSEKQRDFEFNLSTMEGHAWRYKQRCEVLAKAQAEAAGQAFGPAIEPNPTKPESLRETPAEADIFSLAHRLEPTRFKPVAGAWVIVPELMRAEEMRGVVRYCRRHRLNLSVVFHDAIAVTHAELVADSIRRNHAGYMRELCRADLVLAVSAQSATDLIEFASRENLDCPPVTICPNGASFPGARHFVTPVPTPPVNAICVGTIDPRKNHRSLIKALEQLRRDHPELDLRVTLIGNAYAGAENLVDLVNDACRKIPGLEWLRGADDDALTEAYRKAHFTIFPSLLEGFGIPVLESLWHGRPCICADTGAVAENAADGGCLTVKVDDPVALAEAILALATDHALRQRLTEEAKSRLLKTWREQAIEVIAQLDNNPSRYTYGRV